MLNSDTNSMKLPHHLIDLKKYIWSQNWRNYMIFAST